jgi:hypothetical protein
MNENFDLKGSNRTLLLEIVKQAVTLSLDDPNTSALFGQPVDISSLPDYLDIVESPKDLGTILSDINASIEGDGPYGAIDDILQDVNLVWQNCLEYNNRPEDAQIISICRNSKRLFGRMLQKACKEAGVEPDVFSIGKKTALYAFTGPAGQGRRLIFFGITEYNLCHECERDWQMDGLGYRAKCSGIQEEWLPCFQMRVSC